MMQYIAFAIYRDTKRSSLVRISLCIYLQAFVTDRAIQSRLAESLSTGRHAGDDHDADGDHDRADDHAGQSDDHADGHEDNNNDHQKNYVFKLH